jgi:sulfatase modifying factor 1
MSRRTHSSPPPEGPLPNVPEAPATGVSAGGKSGRQTLWLGLVVLAFAAGGYGAVQWINAKPAAPRVVVGDGQRGPADMVWIEGGQFMMGSESQFAQNNEKPPHPARVSGFWMDRHHVTNAQFRKFVEATGYKTTAELPPDWETLKPQLPPGTPKPPESALVPGAMVFVGTPDVVDYRDFSRWWRYMPGADWRHPSGPGSNIDGKDEHPVVQVSYADALAYAKWAGKRLPTEAEWEYAARGGLEQATYVWGDDFAPGQKQMANVWQGQQDRPFPVVNAKAGGAVGTSPAGTFPPNAYGLVDMTGNAWQWVSDWYRADQFAREARIKAGKVTENPLGPTDSFDPSEPGVPVNAPKRVTRGGSFLCNEDYCMSYRPSARRGTDPYTSMSHLGFRLVMDDQLWKARQQDKTRAAKSTGATRGS